MNNIVSYDEHGPMISLGDLEYTVHTGLPGGPSVFSQPTYLAYTSESAIIVDYKGYRLKTFSEANDHYGFGSSPATALLDGQKTIDALEGINADIRVVVDLTKKLCLISQDEPFYNGSQRIHHVPMTWGHKRIDDLREKQEFVVWENGEPTPAASEFYDRITDLISKDAAPGRKGTLRDGRQDLLATFSIDRGQEAQRCP